MVTLAWKRLVTLACRLGFSEREWPFVTHGEVYHTKELVSNYSQMWS